MLYVVTIICKKLLDINFNGNKYHIQDTHAANPYYMAVISPLSYPFLIYLSFILLFSKRLWHSFLICSTFISLRPLGAILAC